MGVFKKMIGFYNYTVILTYISLCSAVFGIIFAQYPKNSMQNYK